MNRQQIEGAILMLVFLSIQAVVCWAAVKTPIEYTDAVIIGPYVVGTGFIDLLTVFLFVIGLSFTTDKLNGHPPVRLINEETDSI